MIDLRSDTVTKPTLEMREAMAAAPVGDDVYGEDPTVNALQERMALFFGFEAGLFMPSGVMSNQVGLKVLTQPGDEIIIDEKGHIFNYENTSAAVISGVQLRTVKGSRGKLSSALVRNAVRPGYDWEPQSQVLVIENTTNKGGGACYSQQQLDALQLTAEDLGLAIHLDGARIWNAMEATGLPGDYFGSIADTMSVCFSKGLGAPVGSMLLSSQENIAEARRYRKMLGGGMRQIGLLAAAADYAVEHHRELLKDDHRRARQLAETISHCSALSIDEETVETNILIFTVEGQSAKDAAAALSEQDIFVSVFGPQTLRVTFHHQISDADLEKVIQQFEQLFG